MKKIVLLLSLGFFISSLFAGTVEKTYSFSNYSVKPMGIYSSLIFPNTMLSGIKGEPMLPYQSVSLLLPPGETAQSIEIITGEEISIPGTFVLYPQQPLRPISAGPSGEFIRNDNVYRMNGNYPRTLSGRLMTQYLNGYSFALSTFTPLQYNPSTGQVSYFRNVTVRIHTTPGNKSMDALKNLRSDAVTLHRVSGFAQNPEIVDLYPRETQKSSNYQILIITPQTFSAGFANLVNYYRTIGMEAHIMTTDSIYTVVTGIDSQEKIRNLIKQEYQSHGVSYVLLGGGDGYVPHRGFYCYVESGSGYEDTDIPADLYYSGMDGNYDANGNQVYGEPDDDPDLLPDVAVGRFPFEAPLELAAMVHKTVSYQKTPVLGEMKRPLMAGEFLTDTPPTWGGDYMDLLIDNHTDNGYFTHGIPSGNNDIERMYDSPLYTWSTDTIIAEFNEGHSFFHHLGHANTDYMMKLTTFDITDDNFSLVDGIHHNYALLYTQGCYCGAFDQAGCVAVKSVTINNFLVAGIFNSRYGWFDQGMTEGPSQHLEREFVSALYTDTLPENHIGATHMNSKIKTAPWVTLPGEFEPGAQRWCHYCCNLLGDPALWIWTDEPSVGIQEPKNETAFTFYPNPAKEKINIKCTLPSSANVHFKIMNVCGQEVSGSYDFPLQAKGDHSYALPLPGLSGGIYFLKMETGTSAKTLKLTIQE